MTFSLVTSAAPSKLRAVVLMLVAIGFFTALDSIMKHLSASLPVMLVVWVRYLLQALFFASFIPFLGARAILATSNLPLQILRGLLLSVAGILVILSLRYMSLTQTYAVSVSAPLMGTALAVPLLGERPTRRQWWAILGGFVGVVIALAPSPSSLDIVLLLPLAMALANAAYQLATRFSGKRDGALALSFYVGLFGACWTGLALPWNLAPLSWSAIGWFLAAGVTGSVGQLLMIQAYRLAPMVIVSPMVYSAILWAIVVGWFAFGETPTVASLAGGAIVAVSGIVLLRARGGAGSAE